ncbi:hypothetical protein ACQY0O_008230 [Thecaphora frezii]
MAGSTGSSQAGPSRLALDDTLSSTVLSSHDVENHPLSGKGKEGEPEPSGLSRSENPTSVLGRPSSPTSRDRFPDAGHRNRLRRSASPGIRLPSASERRRARDMASALLRLTKCNECEGPVNEPVTLPCGHTACLQCIRNRCLAQPTAADEVPSLPCTTHIPPRLPLSPLTVSCPVSGCPRSAIGRGMGRWSGHRPRYGLVPSYTERLPTGSENVGPGSPPLDGFVIGVSDHPHRLTVVGPQCRTKAHLFAVPPIGVEITASNNSSATSASLLPSLATSNLLRPDVTLSKAIAILKRYVTTPVPPRPSRARKSPPRSFLRTRGGRPGRRRNATALGRGVIIDRRAISARGRGLSLSGASGSMARGSAGLFSAGRGAQRAGPGQGRGGLRRSQLSRPVVGLLGTRESDLESGTVGGVRAHSETDEEVDAVEYDDLYGEEVEDYEDDGLTDYDSSYDERDEDDGGYHARFRSGLEDEGNDDPGTLWPDGVGGAYARPLASSSRNTARVHRKRRRARTQPQFEDPGSSPGTKEDALRHGPTRRLYDDAESRHGDSGWTTEDSALTESLASQVPPAPADGAGSLSATTSRDRQASDLSAKHSFALSTKTGPNGEALVQTVATLHSELLEVLECQLCYLLLYQPLTTPCGHTFCKSCFARSLDHGDRCPLCRAEMPNVAFFSEHPSNVALLRILTADTATLTDESDDSGGDLASPEQDETSFKVGPPPTSAVVAAGKQRLSGSTEQADQVARSISSDGENNPHHLGFKKLYDNRKAAIEQEEREARLSTPIFVCTLAFPQMPTILHIFEPRYRLMIRRCLESGNPRFGMVLPSKTNGGLDEYGTMLEIKSVQMLTDGRSMLETVGSYRFRLLEKGSLDGYTVGRIERIDDISLEEEAELEHEAMLRRQVLEGADDDGSVHRHGATPPRSVAEGERSHHDASADTDATSRRLTPQQEANHGRPEPTGDRDADAQGALSLYRQDDDSSGVTMRTAPSSTGRRTESDAESDNAGEPGLPPYMPMSQEPSTAELVDMCRSFIATLRSGSAPWLLTRLNNAYGPMPEAHEVERLGYWMALVMPIDEHEKAKLLPIRSRRVRLCMVVDWIEQLRQSWWFSNGCTVS